MKLRRIAFLMAAALGALPVISQTTPSAAGQRRGLVDISVACVRTAPAHSSELATQALMGTPLIIEENSGEWRKVTLPDGYEGFVNSSSITELTPEEFDRWRSSRRLIITADGATTAVADTLASGARNIVSDLVGGCIIEAGSRGDRWQEITLPDGRRGFIPADAAEDLIEVSKQGFSTEKVLSTAYAMTGTPYLWGGTSAKALDCSGLVKCGWLRCGIVVPRDASQQAVVGLEVDADAPENWEPADLLFFTNRAGRVVHVAIYDGDGYFIHSSGRVRRSHIDPGHPDYDGRSPVIVRRFAGAENATDIVPIYKHPWYVK